jgi:hypothetical protein
MKRIMNIMMLSCKKASSLIDKRVLLGLSVIERIQLTVHTKMCETCRAYQQQSQLLDKAIQSQVSSDPDHTSHPSKKLSNESKSQIIKSLEKK